MSAVNKTNTFNVEDRARDLRASRRQRRYPMPIVRLAREMYAGGAGWSPTEIARYLKRTQGIGVHPHTVRLWVVPGADDVQRERNRASYHRRQGRPNEWRLDHAALARRLRAEGEPVEGIVRVCRVVFGGRWTRGRVLRLLEDES